MTRGVSTRRSARRPSAEAARREANHGGGVTVSRAWIRRSVIGLALGAWGVMLGIGVVEGGVTPPIAAGIGCQTGNVSKVVGVLVRLTSPALAAA